MLATGTAVTIAAKTLITRSFLLPSYRPRPRPHLGLAEPSRCRQPVPVHGQAGTSIHVSRRCIAFEVPAADFPKTPGRTAKVAAGSTLPAVNYLGPSKAGDSLERDHLLAGHGFPVVVAYVPTEACGPLAPAAAVVVPEPGATTV